MTSQSETLLAVQLEQAGILFEREYRFAPPRKWRFDFVLSPTLSVEVEGGAFTGGHRRGAAADLDCEKADAAALMGWTVLRFTTAMVNDGRAYSTIVAALLQQAAA